MLLTVFNGQSRSAPLSDAETVTFPGFDWVLEMPMASCLTRFEPIVLQKLRDLISRL